MDDSKTILLKILEIIGYSEDKDKFAAEFLQNVRLLALIDLFNTLPQDKKDQLQQKLTAVGDDAVKLQEELRVYFTAKQVYSAIENSSKNSVTEYMKTIEPTLSDSQKQNLTSYFSELAKNPPPAAT